MQSIVCISQLCHSVSCSHGLLCSHHVQQCNQSASVPVAIRSILVVTAERQPVWTAAPCSSHSHTVQQTHQQPCTCEASGLSPSDLQDTELCGRELQRIQSSSNVLHLQLAELPPPGSHSQAVLQPCSQQSCKHANMPNHDSSSKGLTQLQLIRCSVSDESALS